MPLLTRNYILPAADFRSREAGSFMAQLEDLSERLREDSRSLTPAVLAWRGRERAASPRDVRPGVPSRGGRPGQRTGRAGRGTRPAAPRSRR